MLVNVQNVPSMRTELPETIACVPNIGELCINVDIIVPIALSRGYFALYVLRPAATCDEALILRHTIKTATRFVELIGHASPSLAFHTLRRLIQRISFLS